MEIYDYIISKAVLSDNHREELKEKRGFTNETIEKYKLFSGGNYLLALEPEMIKQFSADDLVKSGVFLKKSNALHLSPSLLEDKIIIPYLEKDGSATVVRPHKLGLKNVGVQIFKAHTFTSTGVIIAEGEFKAIAAAQLGASAIAIPGISACSKDHYGKLKSLLVENEIRNICIMFDNEVKDDPSFKNYKPDAMDRYDTQYYAYLMAKMLCKDGFNAVIATLPDSWRINGKIDIDGALSSGKTAADLDYVCKAALDPKVYFEELPEEAREIIRKKEKKRYFKSHVFVDFGCYVARRQAGKKEWEERISNFTIKIVATHETSDGLIREMQFVNESGRSTSFFAIKPEDMMSADSFGAFCLRHGNYVWYGKKEDLLILWEMEFLSDSGRHIIEPDCIGWLDEKKIWMFGNVAYMDDKQLRPDAHGIFWTEKYGIKVSALSVSSGKSIISEGVPYLNLADPELDVIRTKFSESIGSFEAKTCLGWCCAVLFMEEIFKSYGCFPFLFITGLRRSGKSTVAEWLMNLYGLENSGKQAADTTSVAIQRYMSYYSSLPLFVDEYRNDAKVTPKNGLFRNAYNRQSAGKGIKSEFGIREAKIRGTLIIAGEETPEDNALLTRCVVVHVTERKRTVNNFDWFMRNRSKLSTFTHYVLGHRKELVSKFMDRLTIDKTEIYGHVADDRLAINRAAVSAGHWLIYGDDEEFSSQFANDLTTTKEEHERENAVSMFFRDVQALAFDSKLSLDNYWRVADGKIHIYFHGLYNVWSKDYASRRSSTAFKMDSIRSYLKFETGFLDSNVNYRLDDKVRSCVVFDEKLSPEYIRDLVGIC